MYANPEPYSEDLGLIERNRNLRTAIRSAVKPYYDCVNQYRHRAGLNSVDDFSETWSTLAQISQQPASFEYPRRELPECFHFTGPFSNPTTRAPISFPYQSLSGQPLAYASLGTLQNRHLHLFRTITEACADLDVPGCGHPRGRDLTQ